MVKYIAAIIVSFLTSALAGQMLNNVCGNALDGRFCFDETFMATNGIDSIEVSFQKKRSGKKLWKSNDVIRMAFDPNGRMREYFQTKAVSTITDSTHVLYTFNDTGTWVKKQEKDRRGYYIEAPVFDDQGRVAERQFFKAPSPQKLEDKNPVAGTQINKERYTYSGDEETEVVTVHNNYDLPYTREEIKRSPDGFLLEQTQNYLVTGRRKSTTFTYNERGWIDRTTQTDSHRKTAVEHRFIYDQIGNITQMEIWENDVHMLTWEVVYDEIGRIDGIIIVEIEDNSMDIWNFSYPERS